ncbi:MAG: VIT1/CCC1 transporter family protein [Proteobacteria bacterium]|nr:VIT1/CCC1 transporter family protein [Pseudomonadota bacterium]
MAGSTPTRGEGWAIGWFGLGIAVSFVLSACTTSTESSFEGPAYSDETRRLEKQMMGEAAALGTAQGVAGAAASMIPMGAGSLVTTTAGRAARDAMIIRHDKLMREQVERDNAEFYKRYGITDADAGPAVADQSAAGPRRCPRRGMIRRC